MGILGIDIGTYSIKIVEMEKEGNRQVLKNYAAFNVVGESADGHAHNKLLIDLPVDELAHRIKILLNRANFKSRAVSMSIPVYSSFVTNIEMPKMSKSEIEKSISFEAKKYIPVPLEEVMVDWYLIGDEGEKTNVLLMAAPKELVAKYQTIAQVAGLELKSLEIETFSSARSVVGNDTVCSLIYDFGEYSIGISIVDNGVIKFFHNLTNLAGGDINRSIMKIMNIGLEKARDFKEKRGLNLGEGEKEISDIIFSLFGSIARETERVLNVYNQKFNHRPERIIIGGGSALMPGIKEYFKENLKIETAIANPFKKIVCPPELEKRLEEIGPSFINAVGLAIKEL